MSGVVLVSGPRSAGVTCMVEELRRRIPGRSFAETCEIEAGVTPAAVVFVVSAVAPITESDCVLADRVTAQTEVVVAVVSKVDDHRGWRGVLALDRERLAGHAERFGNVAWVGAAAAPRSGEPLMGDLVAMLQRRLDDPGSARRNSLRAEEFRLRGQISQLDAQAEAADRRALVAALRVSREQLIRERLLLGQQAAVALRTRMQQARVTLTFFTRNRCAATRTELLAQVAGMNRRQWGNVEECALRRCRDLVAEVDEEIAVRVSEVAADLGVADPPGPAPRRDADFSHPVASGSLEARLMAVLGVAFGLGPALLVSRLFAVLERQASVVGLAGSAVFGLAITVWVVRSRRLLQDRALLDRWVNEVTGEARAVAEERVATGVLGAEAALSPGYLAYVDEQRRTMGGRLAVIDAELAAHTSAIAGAEAARECRMPPLREALRAVREALAEENPAESKVTGQ